MTGEPTLSVHDELPKLLSPSLHAIPEEVTDEGTLARFPHLELLTRRKKRDLLRLRHHVELGIQEYLNIRSFTKVTTPILAADTGGAAARPFETLSNEFPERPLQLRIAQELALKKLVAADMGAVYEIGPVFRNEGLDATHNPEFTTCEFYLPYAHLAWLMRMTEDLVCTLHSSCVQRILESLQSLEDPLSPLHSSLAPGSKFRKLPFLSTLMDQILRVAPEFRLPQTLSEDSVRDILPLFEKLRLPIPARPTTARLLDSLASHFIEPLCQEPTFIISHPAIMSPLAKSFVHPQTGHLVSARAELFIRGTEYINMYEEENDPFLQAKKFLYQSQAEGREDLTLDLGDLGTSDVMQAEAIKKLLTPGQRYYVRVLEMGLPPIGGWGCGIDRLVMLFGGAKRIQDVLPFGNLRNVIAMGTDIQHRLPVPEDLEQIDDVKAGESTG